MSISIVYGSSLSDRRPGGLITQGPDWRREAAYYLTIGYVLIRITAGVMCVRCKGRAQVLKDRRKRKRIPPCYVPCRACDGYGYIAETVLDHTSVTAEEYRPYV